MAKGLIVSAKPTMIDIPLKDKINHLMMKGISLVRCGTINLLSPFEDAITSMGWFNIGMFDIPCEDH